MYIGSGFVVAYLFIGFLVSLGKHYWSHVGTAAHLGNAILATFLWPAIIFGSSNFHHFFK